MDQLLHRRIDFVAAGSASTESFVAEPKRPRTAAALPPLLEKFVRTGCFEVLVADPRPTDVFSQSLTFDVATHEHMQADSARCAAFADALSEHARDKIVLEIGTGPSALLAVLAARAGAERVYAVEGDAAAAAAAQKHVEQLVQAGSLAAGRIVVLHRFSTELTPADVPERVDMVLHELLGTFASSEGVRYFLGAAQPRVLGAADSHCLSIPHRASTVLAPGVAPSLELLLRVPARHTAIGPGQKYLIVGRAGALPPELLMAAAQPFEDLLFNAARTTDGDRRGVDGDDGSSGNAAAGAEVDGSDCGADVVGVGCERPREERTLRFTADRDGTVDGFYAWLRFQAAAGHRWVDSYSGSLHGQSTSWAVLFLPLPTPIALRAGETLRATCTVIGGDTRAPSYAFRFDGAEGPRGSQPPPLYTVPLSLAELYPLNGGAWCRACAGTTASVAEEGTAWRHCAACGHAYHRLCCSGSASIHVHAAREEAAAAATSWTCHACAARSFTLDGILNTEKSEHRIASRKLQK